MERLAQAVANPDADLHMSADIERAFDKGDLGWDAAASPAGQVWTATNLDAGLNDNQRGAAIDMIANSTAPGPAKRSKTDP
jgi:hypothetical protein